jgi:hypothetical protein
MVRSRFNLINKFKFILHVKGLPLMTHSPIQFSRFSKKMRMASPCKKTEAFASVFSHFGIAGEGFEPSTFGL